MKKKTGAEPVVADIVLFHRKRARLTQAQLAALAGVGKTTVFDIEKHKETVKFKTLQEVLRALNIHISFDSPLMDEYRKTLHETR
jgi:HTH-type transcriptional regulator / antitoxin HipB